MKLAEVEHEYEMLNEVHQEAQGELRILRQKTLKLEKNLHGQQLENSSLLGAFVKSRESALEGEQKVKRLERAVEVLKLLCSKSRMDSIQEMRSMTWRLGDVHTSNMQHERHMEQKLQELKAKVEEFQGIF